MKIFSIISVIVIIILFIAWLGFQIKPSPFPRYAKPTGEVRTIPLPKGLPKPVDRYYRVTYGNQIPVITSAVIDGRGFMRPIGPFYLPARFRFTHVAGQDYRHYIEVTFFGHPILNVNEWFVDGHGKMELPFATDEGEKYDQAANLGLWAETNWFPAVYLMDGRVKWLPVDDDTAILNVPLGEKSENFIIRFDPATGFVTWMESMRYHASTSTEKTLWMNRFEDIRVEEGIVVSQTGSAIWMDDGKPWAYLTLESITLNADAAEYVRQKGL